MTVIIDSLYKITRMLDSGGGGVVYLGQHLRLNKDVVLKADRRILSEQNKQPYQREVELLKNLSHTYIPQVYDYVSEGEVVYTVIDYIEGESLDKPLRRGEQFSSAQVVKWAGQVLEALVYLHNRPPYGILHSDIKPSNIMLRPEGNICLIDFNIALALGEEGAVYVGRSQGYASPEHYGMDYSGSAGSPSAYRDLTAKTSSLGDADTILPSDAQTVMLGEGKAKEERSVTPISTGSLKKTITLDSRSDIYGLGATLYHLVTGRRPAGKATEVIPITDDDCPTGLAAIINKAMSPDRDQRFQTAEEMLAAFTDIRKDDPRSRKFIQLRRIASIILVVLLAAGSFATYTGLKRMQWDDNVKVLVGESSNALAIGNIPDAVRYAMEAIPDKFSLFKSPPSAIAQKALTDALGVYDMLDGFKPYQTITLPSAPLMVDLSPDGKTAAIVYAYNVDIVDLDKGKTIATLPMIQSAFAEARFLNNDTLVYASSEGLGAADVTTGNMRWNGGMFATAVAVSANGSAIATINRDDDYANIYNSEGILQNVIPFNGKKQHIPKNDTLANPGYNLFALSASGRFLAVSFDDGTLYVYNTSDKTLRYVIPLDTLEERRFEGGFFGELLAFSATSTGESQVDVYDIENQKYLNGLSPRKKPRVVANEYGIFVSSSNMVIEFDPYSGDLRELATTDTDVECFAVCNNYTLAALNDGGAFFDDKGQLISRCKREYQPDMTLVSNGFALLGGRNGSTLTLFKNESKSADARVLAYDREYDHAETRINTDKTRVMLFSGKGFQLYNSNGSKICEKDVLDPTLKLIDQQFSKASGNLALIYSDALRIYSGQDGSLLFEETDLRSVFYAPYGISILDNDGKLRLIDADSGEAKATAYLDKSETFAAFCGTAVTSTLLDGRKLIGAAQIEDGYLYVVSNGDYYTLYDQNTKERFTVSISDNETSLVADNSSVEAFFTEDAVVISPLHGVSTVYSLKNGKKIHDLEKDAYLTYITQLDDYIVSQYITIPDGEQYGVLLDAHFQPIASLPNLRDISDGQLIFDYPQGYLRQSKVCSLEEILEQASGFLENPLSVYGMTEAG